MAPPPPPPSASSSASPPPPPPNPPDSLPLLRLPLIVSESLRSSLLPPPLPPHHDSSHASSQGVVSILLSSSDLAKLDLSKLQLFSIHGTLDMLSSSSSASVTALSSSSSSSASALHSAATSVVDSRAFLVGGNPTEVDDTSLYNHSTPLVLSPAVVDIQQLSDDVPVSILKSKAVVEAEKACVEQEMVRRGAISPSPRARRRALSMDEVVAVDPMWMNGRARGEEGQKKVWGVVREQQQQQQTQQQQHEQKTEEVRTVGDDDAKGVDDERQKKKKTAMAMATKEEEEEAGVARIDLRASPAAKFLVQVMPWELTPPITPATTPAAVPFLWEVVPGQPKPKPKPRLLPSPCASLPLPPRLLLLQPQPFSAVAEPPSIATTTSSDPLIPAPNPPPSLPATAIGPPSSADLSSPPSPTSTATAASDAQPSLPPRSAAAAMISLPDLHSTREAAAPNFSARHGSRHRKNTHSWHVLQNLRLHLHGHSTDSASASHRQRSPEQEEKAISGTGRDESATRWSDEYDAKAEEEKNQRILLKPTSTTADDALPVKKLSRTNSLVRLLSKVKQKSRVLSWKSAYLQRAFRKSERGDQIGPFPSS